MAVTIDSTRFGAIEILDEAVVEFPTGLIGLGGRRYAFLHREESAPFVWLHSLDDPSLAIRWPVGEPILSDRDRRNPTLNQLTDRLPTWVGT